MNNHSQNLRFYRSWKQDSGRPTQGHMGSQRAGLKARASDLQSHSFKIYFLNFTQAVHKHALVIKKKKRKGGGIDHKLRAATWGVPRRQQRETLGAVPQEIFFKMKSLECVVCLNVLREHLHTRTSLGLN